MTDKTRSHLLKAQQIEKGINSENLLSVQMTQAQDAAEHAFRAILFGMSIKRVGEHRLDIIANENKKQLKDIWDRLEPLLEDYAWLWKQRNIARYSHIDCPPIQNNQISKSMVERALKTTTQLISIAERMI